MNGAGQFDKAFPASFDEDKEYMYGDWIMVSPESYNWS